MQRPWILLNTAGEPAGGGTPAAPPVPPPPPAAVIPPVTSGTPQPGDETQPWFKERIDRAKRDALTELGITDPAKAKKLLEDAAKAEEEAKTTGQKLGETSATLAQERAERERLAAVVKDHAGRQMVALATEQQAAIRAIAPDSDPAAQLRAIDALRPTWATAAPPVAPPVTPPAPPAAGTAPPPNAPPQNGSVSPPDHKAIYEGLKKTNPHAASAYVNKHHAAIYAPRSP